MGLFDFFRKKDKRFDQQPTGNESKRCVETHREQVIQKSEERQERKGEGEDAYLVVFSTEWCGPSKRFLKEIQQAGISCFTLIDAEKEEDLACKFSIRNVPTTILLDKDENVIEKWIGYDDEDPGQSKFVDYIKTSSFQIHPYSELRENNATKQMHRAISSAATALPPTKNSEVKEDNRTTFYKLEDIKRRSMGGDLMLSPYDAEAFFSYPDASVLSALANTDKIRRFLPGLGFEDEEKTRQRLEGYMLKTESQLSVTYVIRSSNVPLGMIFVNTPLYNKKTINLAIWTIDFFISEILEHKGVMFHSILRVLNEMKISMGAKEVYATVDKENEDCKRLLGNGLFKLIDNTGFIDANNPSKAPLVYKIDLSTIRFEKR